MGGTGVRGGRGRGLRWTGQASRVGGAGNPPYLLALQSVFPHLPYTLLSCDIDLFWTAPELLRNKARQPKGTQAGDLYSYAMILVEILTRKKLYSGENKVPQCEHLIIDCYHIWDGAVTIYRTMCVSYLCL